MVARVRDIIDGSAPLTDPGFLRFMAGPPDDAKIETEGFMSRLSPARKTTTWMVPWVRSPNCAHAMDGIGEAYIYGAWPWPAHREIGRSHGSCHAVSRRRSIVRTG